MIELSGCKNSVFFFMSGHGVSLAGFKIKTYTTRKWLQESFGLRFEGGNREIWRHVRKLDYGGEAQIQRGHTLRLTVSRAAGEHISAEMLKLRRWPFANLKWSGITLFDDLETANRKVKYHCYPLSNIHRHFDSTLR